MIQTWIANVSSLMDENIYQQFYDRVPEFRKEKADKLRFQEDKALSVGAWILLEKMRETFKLTEENVYNLSHSGNYVLCSVEDGTGSAKKVGCDLEMIKNSHDNVAKRFYCEKEYEMVLANEMDFYRLWVLKESFMKATRLGMKLDTRSFEFEFDQEDKPKLKTKPNEIDGEFYFKEYETENIPYRIAVCADADEFAEKLKMVNL